MNAHPSRGRTGFLRSGMCPAVERKMVGSELDRPSAMRHACARRAPMRRSRGRDQAGRLPIAMLTTASSAAERRRVRPWQSLRRHGARLVARLPRLRSLIAGWLPHLLQGWGSRDATDDVFTDTQPRYGLEHVAHTRHGRELVQGLHVIGQPDKWLAAQSHQSPFATPQPRGLGKDVGG